MKTIDAKDIQGFLSDTKIQLDEIQEDLQGRAWTRPIRSSFRVR